MIKPQKGGKNTQQVIPIKVRKVVTFGGEDGAVVRMGTSRPSGWLAKLYILTCVVIMRLFTHYAFYLFCVVFCIYGLFYNKQVKIFFKS